jgi:hypothetical protein
MSLCGWVGHCVHLSQIQEAAGFFGSLIVTRGSDWKFLGFFRVFTTHIHFDPYALLLRRRFVAK